MVAVVIGYAAPGSIGGRSPRLAVNLAVAVWVIVHVLREKGKRFLRGPRRCGVPLGLMVGPRVVLTSGVGARGACE